MPTETTSLLKAEALTVGIAARNFVENLSISLGQGASVCLEGPSGAGKTSVLRALALLDAPRSGRVFFRGAPVQDVPTFRQQVSFVAQRPAVFSGTVEANLRRPFSFRAQSGRFDRERAMALLARLGLDDVLDKDAERLSEGEKQRVCFARALLTDPAVLLLDEPTSALDDVTALNVESEVNGFLERDGAVVLISHDERQRQRLCTQSILIGERAAQPDATSPAPHQLTS